MADDTNMADRWRIGILDRLAVILGMWSLRRLYGAGCKTDIRDDFPDDPTLRCISCDAGRLIADMKELLS
jgi:hypothetical protein